MVNYQVRVVVTLKKKTLFERILSPESAARCNVDVVLTGLRQLFPHDASIMIESYGVRRVNTKAGHFRHAHQLCSIFVGFIALWNGVSGLLTF